MRSPIEVTRRLVKRAMRKWLGTITGVVTEEPVAALTFDDGPHPEFTPRLLEVLGRHGAQATFFMVGEVAQRHPEIVQQVAQAGHALGNHSWDHPSFPLITRRERYAQIRACARAIAPYGQRLFRPPYGHQSRASRLDAWILGYQVITWSFHAEDWLRHDAGWIARRLLSQVRPGSIILLHDALYHTVEEGCADRRPMIEAVDAFLEELRGRLRFVTVPELLRLGRPRRRPWYWQPDPAWLNQLRGEMGEARRYPVEG